jgi:hypothetical protein
VSAHRYAAYGLRIESEVPLPGFLASNGTADVVVRLGPVEPDDTTSASPRYRGTTEEGRLYWRGIAASIRRGGEIVVASDDATGEDALAAFVVGPALGILLTQRGLVALHASCVEFQGRAVAFVGAPRSGKSTVAAALHARGHGLVADDIVAVRVDEDTALVLPGAPQLRLWPEAARELGDDPDQLDRVRDDLEKRIRPAPAGFSPDPVPLAAVYVLESGGKLAIAPMRPSDAVVELLCHSWTPRSLHSTQPAARLAHYGAVVGAVPVRRLRRPDALGRVREVAELVERELEAAA